MEIRERMAANVEELRQMAVALNEAQLEQAARACMGSQRIFFSGMGRSGHMIRALAVRFLHLGYDAYVAGEAAAPSIGKGDLLIAVSSSAKTKVTMQHVETARKCGAGVLLVSSLTENPEISDYFLSLPAKTKVPSAQHAGSLFEQAVLLAGDAVAAHIKAERNISGEYMNQRHANLQ